MASLWIFIVLSSLSLRGLSQSPYIPIVTVELYQTNYTVEESYSATGSGISVCLHVSGVLNSSVDLQFTATGGSATEGLDYILVSNYTLELSLYAQQGNDYCIEAVQICDDFVPENDEDITVLISTDNPEQVYLLQNNFTVTIADNDRISVAFTRDTYTVGEGSEVEVCVETSGTSERGYVPLTMVASTGTATNVDFFVAGIQLNGMGNRFQKCMTMTAVDDDLPEDTEYFRIRVSSSDSLVDIDRRNPVRVYITDNDPVTFFLDKRVSEVTEGETAEVCLIVGNHDLPRIRFHLIIIHLSGNASGQDYTVQNPRGFTIGRGGFTPTNEVCFDVLTNNDLVSEGTETAVFQLLLSTEVAWVELDMPEEALTELIILDNDFVIVEFGHISYAVTEGSFGYISLCIVVNGMTNRHPQPTLHISTTSVSAVGGTDYEDYDVEVQLPGSSFCHDMQILDDVQPECEEIFHICIETHSPLIQISTECAEVHIIDNDAPELVWSELQYTVTESSGSSEICAQIIGTLNEVVEIPLSTADITAVGLYDYFPGEHIFSFGPTSEQTQCLNMQILRDELVEDVETFRVALTLDGVDDVSLNISRPYTYVHIQDDSNEHASVCMEGTALLNEAAAADNNDSYSLVEMCDSTGRWVSVCDSHWSGEDTAVVCRQAGYGKYATSQRSLPSLETAARVFVCSSTETSLVQCWETQPDNTTCQHLQIICAKDDPAKASIPTDESTTPSLNQPVVNTSLSSSFPVVGVVVGILSALLLVGVVMVIGVVVRAIMWKRRKSTSEGTFPANDQSHRLENPVYAVLENGGPPTPLLNSQSSGDSCQTNSELYSEILPLETESPDHAAATLPSFYDVVRLPTVQGDAQVMANDGDGEGKEEREEEGNKKVKGSNGVLDNKSRPAVEANMYATLTDCPVSCQDENGDYSSLERRRGYATLEPYTGTLTHHSVVEKKTEKTEKEDEEYAHLHH